MSASVQYYIRGVDGKIFGPVDTATLVDWARDSRIEPAFTVSRDRQNWLPAPRLAELEMNWLVETDPGTFYGPFNRAVVDNLNASGALPAKSRFYRLDDGSSSKDAQCEVGSELAGLTEENSRLNSALAAREKALVELEERFAKQAETTKKTIAFMEAKLAELTAAQTDAGKAAEAELAAAREEIYRARERAERAEANVAEAQERIRESEAKASRAESERETIEKRLSVAETELSDLRSQLEAVTRVTAPVRKDPAPAAEVVVVDVPPKSAPRFGAKGGAGGLAALEAAAARELAAAKKQGLNIGGIFGGRK